MAEPRFEIYRGDSIHGIGTGRWHWRFRGSDGKVSAAGNEIFDSPEEADGGIRAVVDDLLDLHGVPVDDRIRRPIYRADP